jgi:hypothetical protein
MGIQVLTWDKNKNAAVLNVIPPLFPLLTFVYICGLKQYKNKFSPEPRRKLTVLKEEEQLQYTNDHKRKRCLFNIIFIPYFLSQ